MPNKSREAQFIREPESLSCVATRFLDDLLACGRSRNTILGYRCDLSKLSTFLDDRAVSMVTAEDLSRFLQADQQIAVATRGRRRAAIASFLGWCARKGYVGESCAAKLTPIAGPERLPRPLRKQDVDAILDAIPKSHQRNRALLTLLAETGMRISEALGIYIEDVNVSRDEGTILVRNPKGRRERIVTLVDAPRSRSLLHRLLRQSGKHSGPLFRAEETKRGSAIGTERPVTYEAVHAAWKRYCARAGVEARIHQLRHTVATSLINDGAPYEVVRRRLGHRTMAMVLLYGQMDDRATVAFLRRRERERTGR